MNEQKYSDVNKFRARNIPVSPANERTVGNIVYYTNILYYLFQASVVFMAPAEKEGKARDDEAS